MEDGTWKWEVAVEKETEMVEIEVRGGGGSTGIVESERGEEVG